MTPELYVDSIDEITVTGSVLRIDLVSMSATRSGPNSQPAKELRQRIIMPIEGYAGSFDLLKRVFESLVTSGAVTPTRANTDAPTPQPPPRANTSPNF